ncbi:hypothetical protein DEO72_LG10g4057 [Vigna unguiculata]|uniref:Uncharacterized protein n=1 Tax=Vigna unguiculata TaxID=3917 RepID=A0A4D6NLQ0_VIGUN|nr:hypothetical protein DEO72_LG10g4057 [Vigna unguiculata]
MRWLGAVGEEEDEEGVVVVARGGGVVICIGAAMNELLASRRSCRRSCVSPQLVKVVGQSYWFLRRSNNKHRQIDAEIRKFGSVKNDFKVFTYAQLVKAINNFSSESLIDEGGFENVYKGYTKSVEQICLVFYYLIMLRAFHKVMKISCKEFCVQTIVVKVLNRDGAQGT